jgi:four helix bundle protein
MALGGQRMAGLANHRELLAWQRAINLVELVYRDTASFPRDEAFGLTAQIRKSAVSIPANIAEGAGRNSLKELIQFLSIASGSKAELDTHLEIARRLGLIAGESIIFRQMERVGQLLTALRKSLQKSLVVSR